MKWTSTTVAGTSLDAAVGQAAGLVFRDLGHREPDLVIAFASAAYGPALGMLADRLGREFESAVLFGCSASGVIGGGREIENRPALSLTAAVLPGVRLAATHFEAGEAPPVFAERRFWEDALGVAADEKPAFLLLADPFTFDADPFLRGLDRACPASTKVGGIASGSPEAGSTALLLGGQVYRSGLIALALTGNVEVSATVTQGCRPVGEPMFVTGAHDNLIRELDGRTPREVLGEIFRGVSAQDRRLIGDSLFIGLGAGSGHTQYGQGDFLIRSLLGLDPGSGALWVGAHVPLNSIVQFHVRDAVAAAQDLERSLKARRSDGPGAAGALLFSCVSRGARFYGQPDHDSNAFRRIIGDIPVGGCFCGGEIGPVRGITSLHGHTSVFGMFGPARLA